MTTDYIDPISPSWEHDHLDRVGVARFLTKYLNSIYVENNPDLSAGHFVLNLNADWGQGKTFLLNHWAADLRENRYPVVAFDAWKNDFSQDPMVGFISELQTVLIPWFAHVAPIKATVEKFFVTAKKVIGYAATVLETPVVAAGVGAASGVPLSGEAVSSAAKAARAYSEYALGKHAKTKELIDELKADLRKLIETIEAFQKERADRRSLGEQLNKEEDIHLPLYVFVDELDRCRPPYAIELLENIKHLFGVKGVFFVVATNKEQLCHSICAIYGNAFDSSAYLGRFFDQEYSLPEPDSRRFAEHLFDKYKLEDDDHLVTSLGKSPSSKSRIAETFAVLSNAFELPLRDQEQTVHRIKAILAVFHKDPIYFEYLVFLLMLRKKSELLFEALFLKYQDRKAFEADLSGIFKGQAEIKTSIIDYYGAHVKAVQESLFSLIHGYLSLSKKDVGTLSRSNVEQGLRVTILIHREAQSGTLSVSDYPKLVRQVGQLS